MAGAAVVVVAGSVAGGAVAGGGGAGGAVAGGAVAAVAGALAVLAADAGGLAPFIASLNARSSVRNLTRSALALGARPGEVPLVPTAPASADAADGMSRSVASRSTF